MAEQVVFNKKPYTIQELGEYVKYIETLDRLTEKSKRNWLGSPAMSVGQSETDKAKAIYDGYSKALLVAQKMYQHMMEKVAK